MITIDKQGIRGSITHSIYDYREGFEYGWEWCFAHPEELVLRLHEHYAVESGFIPSYGKPK